MFSIRLLFLLALAAAIPPASLPAQQPGRQFPPLPVAAPAMPRPLADPSSLVRVQFPNAPIEDVLAAYQDLTGKRVLADQNVNGKINILVNDMVPRGEAIKIIETQLTLNGYSLVASGDSIIKVLGLSKQVRNAGVPLYSDMSMVPEGEQTVSFLLRLRYLDAEETTRLLSSYILPQPYNGFNALEKSGAIIITETANNVHKLVNLINQLDVAAAPVVEEFIRLERADATKAIEFLNSVFEIKANGAATGQPGVGAPGSVNPAAVRRPIYRINAEGQNVPDPATQPILGASPGLVSLNGDSIIQGRITLTADVRTNRINVVTSPVNIPLVEKLVADYDANTPFASPVRRPLRFVNASDVLPILIQALTEPGMDNNGAANSAPTSTPGNQNRSQQNNGNTGNNLFGSNSNGNSSGSDSGIGSEELDTPPVDVKPTEATVGTTKIIADPRSNTIILLGSAEARDKAFKVLDQLDVRPQQVVIRVVIGELSLGNNSEFGLNYVLSKTKGTFASQYNGGFFGSASTSTTPVGATPAPTGTTTSTGTTSLLDNVTALAAGVPSGFSGLAGIISVTKGFDIILSALEATNRFKTVNRPVIFTTNNEKAVIISGQEIAVPTQSLSTATTTVGAAALQTNVQYKTVALQLEVVPLINSEREITLHIVQKLDSLVAGSNTQVGGTNIPTIAKREIKSTVSMPNGATVVLGGLITLSDQKTDGNIPVLSKIPLVGPLFQTRSRNLSRSELIILIHPEVTNTPTELVQQRNEENRHMYLEPNLDEQLTPIVPYAKAVKTTTTTTIKKPTVYPK